MGSRCSVEQNGLNGTKPGHVIRVKTGDRKGSGTDANVRMILRDNKGNASPNINLDCVWRNDFERGHWDTFNAPPLVKFGAISEIVLWRDDVGLLAEWFCEVVSVEDTRTGESYYFPVHRWVQPDRKYVIPQNDTALPQDDPHPEQRSLELEWKREIYKYKQDIPGMPVQVKELPEDEKYSDHYQGELNAMKSNVKRHALLLKLRTSEWKTLEDIATVYTADSAFPKPKSMARCESDSWFGAQRLVGCNPVVVELCTHIPDNLTVTDGLLEPFLEGFTLTQAMEEKRIFITDYKILDNVQLREGHTLSAPIALWFLNGENNLVPLAVQLFQDPSPDNPVFVPSDPPVTWKLAKLWLNLADSTLHQTLTHLGFTHLLMEGVCVAVHRHLACNHPVFRLLAPHFLFLLAINTRGLRMLLAEGGIFDDVMLIGARGSVEMVRRGFESWRLDLHGYLPREIESRGLLDPSVLPNYPYRDDGLLVFNAIHIYITNIVKHYYDEPCKISQDTELQAWAKELATSIEDRGVGLKGIPNNGEFKTTQELIETLTSVIYTCSAQHAAVNFGQYDEYGYPPNYPGFLNGHPPKDRYARSDEDFLATLPNADFTIKMMSVTKQLSTRATNKLGDFEFQYQYDPPAVTAHKQFCDELERIGKIIQQRNEERSVHYFYNYLNPSDIPNAISI